MKWRGTLPQCRPQKTCKKFSLNEKHLTEVYHYEKVYYTNTSDWFAIDGTKAHFRCKDETLIFVGKEYRICGKDGEWSDTHPNCLDTDKESKLNITTISVIIMLTLILTFGLSAILVFCVLRMKRMQRNKLSANGMRESNVYDDYDIHGVGLYGKNMDEMYETVDETTEDRYADNRHMQRAAAVAAPVYTDMSSGPYKVNYNDRNVYDDCIDYDRHQPNANTSDLDDSYVVMKVR
ncbi:unnamed protein product [Medioppia subpectinata]|uniref:Sushi domain-containing protein n=1 Tax=Medioppia subpectinata TaxID=1979941 RepID=A0A7R9QFI7_9ACAR|nr:unnamed protein product [Medioppia subpectinata]CAG2119148.1 unnamed protein product [Medioppia subpectinata]